MSDQITLTKKEFEEAMNTVKSIREQVEKYGINSPEFKSYQEKAEKDLDTFEKKISASLAENQKKETELKDRIGMVESLIANFNTAPKSDKKVHRDIVNIFCKQSYRKNETKSKVITEYLKGIEGKTPNLPGLDTRMGKFDNLILETKASPDIWRTDIGELGGFRVPLEYSSELISLITEKTPARAFASVRQIGGKSFLQPVKGVIPMASVGNEADPTDANNLSKTAKIELNVQKRQYKVEISREDLSFDAYDVSQQILDESSEGLARREGREMIRGEGTGGHGIGIITAINQFPQVHETATTTLDFTDLINVSGKLKVGYKPMYATTRKNVAYLRTIKDTAGRYIWNAFGDGAAGPGAVINGYPYSGEFIDLDDYSLAGGYPIIFGDFQKGYRITDSPVNIIIRDEITKANESLIIFYVQRWTFECPWIREALIPIKRKA